MSFLAPVWLGVAAVAAVAVVALHLITTQRPPASPLPTARFVPAGDARAASRAARPTDLLLLLLRCAAVLLLGAAFAGPVTASHGRPLARVVIADRSRGAQGDVRDSAAALTRAGDALVPFDSAARAITAAASDSARAIVPSHAKGSLSAAFVVARRAAAELARGADSVEMVVVSPLTLDELDAATASMLARWPGRVRIARTAAARAAGAIVTLASDDPDDALRPPIAALNAVAAPDGGAPVVRVLRTAPGAADSALARGGAAVVVWPRIGGAVASAQGLWAGNATLVATLARLPLGAGGRVVARWSDGAPAAAEWTLGRGCIRTIAAGVPAAGDVTLQPAFVAVARELLAPCANAASSAAAPDSVAARFNRPGPAATAAVLRAASALSPVAPWLVGAALLFLAGEMFVRRERGGGAS